MNISDFTTKISILFSQKQCISSKTWKEEFPEAVYNIIKIAENFNSDEIDLFYDLLSRYTICDFAAYNALTENALSEVLKVIPNNTSKVYVFPLVKPTDLQKTKSSQFVTYIYQSVILRKAQGSTSFLFNKGNELSQEKQNNNFCVLLVDDFIGTGKTAIDCADDYVNNKNINKNSIVISTFYSMESGFNTVKNAGYKIISLNTMKRGISDYFNKTELPLKYQIIDEIETRQGIPKTFKMGLNQSEALLTLMRTPNNTFPMFWSEKFITPPFRR